MVMVIKNLPGTGPAFVGARAGHLLATWRLAVVSLALLAMGLSPDPVRAANIPVLNGSFESPTPTPPFPVATDVDFWQDEPQPVWFDPDGFGFTWAQTTGAFPNPPEGNPGRLTNMDGAQGGYVLALPGAGMSQELDATYEVGLSYTLTVGMASSSSQQLQVGNTFELSLYYLDALDALVTVASTPITYDTTGFPVLTEFVDFTVNLGEVQAGDAWAGENIGIRLLATSGTGASWDLDNVRLQAIPEPGTWALLALGLGAGLVYQRRGQRRGASVSGHDS
jgi:hypothetical protein